MKLVIEVEYQDAQWPPQGGGAEIEVWLQDAVAEVLIRSGVDPQSEVEVRHV